MKDLVSELIDTGTRLARTGVAGNEPAATKLRPLPPQPAESCDMALAISWDEQKPSRYERQQDSASENKRTWMFQGKQQVWRNANRVERNKIKFHGQTLPIR
ncbi:MAG: hypothetical protein ABSF38_20970 [Verrucomicrobiota bacterium]